MPCIATSFYVFDGWRWKKNYKIYRYNKYTANMVHWIGFWLDNLNLRYNINQYIGYNIIDIMYLLFVTLNCIQPQSITPKSLPLKIKALSEFERLLIGHKWWWTPKCIKSAPFEIELIACGHMTRTFVQLFFYYIAKSLKMKISLHIVEFL